MIEPDMNIITCLTCEETLLSLISGKFRWIYSHSATDWKDSQDEISIVLYL